MFDSPKFLISRATVQESPSSRMSLAAEVSADLVFNVIKRFLLADRTVLKWEKTFLVNTDADIQ